MNQPFSYADLLAKHAKVTQDPEFKDISLPDYAAAMNEITGSQNYDQGLTDNFVRRASHKVDEAIDWTGIPQHFQSVGEGLTSLLGGGPEYQQSVGQAFRGIPRVAGEIGVGLGAAALATAAAPIAVPAGGVAAAGIALGTMAGLTGLHTYGETGSVPQAGVSAATMLAGMKAASMASQPVLRAMGAPTIEAFASKAAPEVAAKLGAEYLPKEIGEVLIGETFMQQTANVAGRLTAMGAVNEVGGAIQRRMQTGEWSLPTGPELAGSVAGLLPFMAYDTARDVRSRSHIFENKVKPTLQQSFIKRGVEDYQAKHDGEMPPDHVIERAARDAGILPPLEADAPKFEMEADGVTFTAKFNSVAKATEWAQAHASRFDGYDLETQAGITKLKVKPKTPTDFMGNNDNNDFLESRNKSYTYRDVGAENVMATVMKYKKRFVDALNEGRPEGKRISEMDLVDDDLIQHINDAHRLFEQDQMKAGTKERPTQEQILDKAIRINTVEEGFSRNLAAKVDPAHLAMEQEAVVRENQRAADLAADAEAVRLMNENPAIKAKAEFASNWYEKERGIGARKETVIESGQHGRTTTAIVGKSVDSEASRAIDTKIANIEQQLSSIQQTELFERPGVAEYRNKLRSDLLELQRQKAELKPDEEATVVEEEPIYNADGERVNEKGEVIDENADEVITGSSYGANSGVKPATPGVSEALMRAAVKYPGELIIGDPASERAFTSYLQGTRTRAEAAYKAQDAQAQSKGIVERFGADEASAKAYAEQRQSGRSEAEVAANVKFEAVKDKNGEWAVRALDQNAIRSYEGNWKTEHGDWADTEMESTIAQFIGKAEEGAPVEVEAERAAHDLNDIRDPAIKSMRYQQTVDNVAAALNDPKLYQDLLRQLKLSTNRKADAEWKKTKTRVLQYIDFIRKGGNLTWKVVRRPAQREVFRTTDRAEAEQFIREKQGKGYDDVRLRENQFTTEKSENNYDVLEEAIMNELGDQVSIGYRVMESPRNLPKTGIGATGRRSFLKVELQGDLAGFNQKLLDLAAKNGVDAGGFSDATGADRSGRLNERRPKGLSPAEEILATLRAVGTQFADPRKLYERPKGDFGFLPGPYWNIGRDQKGEFWAKRIGLYDPETGAYIPANEAVKPIKRGPDLQVTPSKISVKIKMRNGKVESFNGNFATLVDKIFKNEGTVEFSEFVSVMKESLEKDRNATTSPVIDHYNRVLDMLMNKGNQRNWAPNIPVGVAMAKEIGHMVPGGIDGVFGWYNHSKHTLQSSGMLFSPYYVHPITGKVYQMSALEFLPHLIHEATHGNVAHGFDVDPVLREQGIALVKHLKQQLKLDASWAKITGNEPRAIRALRDDSRDDYISFQELAADIFTDRDLIRTLRGMKDDPSLGGNPKPMNNLFNRVMDWIKGYLIKVFPPQKGENVVDGTSLYDRLSHYMERAMEASDTNARVEYKGDIYSAIAKEIFGSDGIDLLGSRQPEGVPKTGDSGVGRVVGGKEPTRTAGLGWSRTIGDINKPKTAADYTEYAKKRNEQTKAERAAADAERARIENDPNRPRKLIKVEQVPPTPSEELAKQRTDALRAELQKKYPDATIVVTRPEKVEPKSALAGGSKIVSWEGGKVEVRSKTEYQPIPTVDLKAEKELPDVMRAQGKRTIPELGKDVDVDNQPQDVSEPLIFKQSVVQEGPAGERLKYEKLMPEEITDEQRLQGQLDMYPFAKHGEGIPSGPKSTPPTERERGPALTPEEEARVREWWPMKTSEVKGGLESRGGSTKLIVLDKDLPDLVPAKEYHLLKWTTNEHDDNMIDTAGLMASVKERAKGLKTQYGKPFVLKVDGEVHEAGSLASFKKLLESMASDTIGRVFKNGNNQIVVSFEDIPRDIERQMKYPPRQESLESRGPISVADVKRAFNHGATAVVDNRENTGRFWFKGNPVILGSVQPKAEQHGWWSLGTEDLQKIASELGNKEDLFKEQVRNTPQITSAYPTLIEALKYQGMSDQEARKGAMLIGRYATAFKVAAGYEKPVMGITNAKNSYGIAWPGDSKAGLQPALLGERAGNTFANIRETFIHELFHLANPADSAFRDIFHSTSPETRRDMLEAASYLVKNGREGEVRNAAVGDPSEFASDLAAYLTPALLSGSPTVAMREAATLLGTDVQRVLFAEGMLHRKAIDVFTNKLSEKGQADWAPHLLKEIETYMEPFEQIQRDTEMFHTMRGLWPDSFLPEVMDVANRTSTKGRDRIVSASKNHLQDSILESRGMLRGEIGLEDGAKYSWWNKTLASFNRLADQFPILKPHWDMLHTASAQAQSATMDLKLMMAGEYTGGKYKSDERSKRWRKFNMTPRLLEAHDKLVMLANKEGDATNRRLTPLEMNTFLERSGRLTDPADRALVLEVYNAQLAQNERVGRMINDAERYRDDIMLARLASKRGAGTVSIEQAKAQAKLVGDWAEANYVGDIVTSTDLANRMVLEIPEATRVEMVELAQGLVVPRMEALNTRSRGIGYWMPERRFGEWGVYYKDKAGDVQRHYFQREQDLGTFMARAGIKDSDIIKRIGPAEKESNFGANPALFEALNEAQSRQVELVRKHLGDDAAEFLQKEGHFLAYVVGNLQSASPTTTSLKRTFGATRQFMTMSDVQQQYIEAAVNSIKNRTVRAENELLLGDKAFDMQPQSKMLVRQHVDQFLKRDSEFGRKAQMANFVYFMGGNISSMVIEPFQQLMALAPVLTHNGAGLAGGYKLIAEANALWAKSKATGSFGNAEYDAAMKQWRAQGDADNGIYSELNHNEDLNLVNTIRRSGGFSQFSPFDLVKNKIYSLANFATKFYLRVPAYNSEIALLASYKLLRSQGLPHEEAVKQAVFLKEGAMFGGGKRNRPVGLFGFNRTGAQVINSLQGYSLGMTSLMGQLIRESFGGKGSGLTPAQITQARKATAQMLMTQFAAAGALGMPFMAAAMTALQKLFPSTNPEQDVRDFLDSFDREDKEMGGVLGTFLSKGLPALWNYGPDFSSRFALGGVMGVNPYNGWTLANLAGPSVSLVTNIFNAGREAAMTGDPRDLKPMMPIGLQKMYDAATQGSSFEDKRGRMLASDLTGVEQAARFAGFTPNRVAETRDTTRLAKINESAARERTSRLANQLADLYQAGEVNRVREKILDMEPHERATMVQAVASRLEQKTMPVDPRTIGSRMSLRSQQELFRLMQTGQVQLPTQQQRLMLHGQVASSLMIPGTTPPSSRSFNRAAAIDFMQQQSPALSKEAASLLLDRRSQLSPETRLDMFPGGRANEL